MINMDRIDYTESLFCVSRQPRPTIYCQTQKRNIAGMLLCYFTALRSVKSAPFLFTFPCKIKSCFSWLACVNVSVQLCLCNHPRLWRWALYVKTLIRRWRSVNLWFIKCCVEVSGCLLGSEQAKQVCESLAVHQLSILRPAGKQTHYL